MKRSLKNIICVAAVICFAGCSTVENARKVQRGELPIVGERTVTFAETGLDASRPLTLEELVAVALKFNPSVMQASQNLEMAKLNLSDVKAEYLPTLGANVSHSRTTNNVETGHTGFSTDGNYNGSLNLNLLIYDFGRTAAAVKQAAEGVKQAELEYENACCEVRYKVRVAFSSLHRTQRLLEVCNASVEQYKEHLNQMLERRDAGVGINYDCTKATVDYQNSLLAQLQAANNVEVARATLNHALGLAENVSFEVASGNQMKYSEDVEELMQQAREKSPILAGLKSEEQAASYYIDEMIADLYPSFSLSLSGMVSGRNPSFPLLWNLSGAASISQNIFNGGRNMNAIDKAVITLRLVRSRYAAAEQLMYYNLREASLAVVLARHQLEVTALTEASSKENMEIVSENFAVGLANSIERTDAQVDYYTAQAQTVSAKYNYIDAEAKIAYLLGE